MNWYVERSVKMFVSKAVRWVSFRRQPALRVVSEIRSGSTGLYSPPDIQVKLPPVAGIQAAEAGRTRPVAAGPKRACLKLVQLPVQIICVLGAANTTINAGLALGKRAAAAEIVIKRV